MNRSATLILWVLVSMPLGMAQSKYVNDVLALNPLGYWRLNGNANDATTHGNNGMLMNGVTFTGPGLGAPVGDPNSQAAVFHAAQDQSISMPTTASTSSFQLDWYHPLTTMIWLRTTWTSNNRVILAKQEGSGNFRGFGIALDNGEGGTTPLGGGRIAVFLQATPSSGSGAGGNFLGVETLTPVNDGTWHFLVFTYDGTDQAVGIKVYVDGAAVSTTLYGNGNSLNGMTTVNNVPVEIGARAAPDDRTFDGLLAEAAIFGTALTAAQVRQLQNDAAPSAVTSVLPHFAVGGSFVTGFSVVNTGSQPANFSISFRDDNGNAVSLPFSGLGTLGTLSDTIVANGAKYYEAGTPQGALIAGSGVVTADAAITIQALFRRLGGDNSYYEVAVPASAGLNEFEIPFDDTTFAATGAQIYTGFAIANLDTANSANVTCTARDATGTIIPGAISVPALNPMGHWAGYLFPALIGQRGTLDCASNTRIGSIGLRALGTNGISSLPVIPIR
jgi:hypothetical protein